MADLTTKYMGLTLKSPVIVGSCGLTNTINEIKRMEAAGAGAVVIKSIFEEQIKFEAENFIKKGSETISPMIDGYLEMIEKRQFEYAEAMEYLKNFAKEHTLNSYLDFIKEVKKSVSIPVIASVNCVMSYDWHFFARKIQEAGADALELNVYILPSDASRTGADNEAVYKGIIESVKKTVNIPVALKLSYYLSGLANKIVELSNSGLNGIVMFNRPYNPDFDIEKMKLIDGHIQSGPAEFAHTLRWVGLLSGKLGCDISATTGVHSAETAIKQILAGANSVQVVSAVYLKGIEYIKEINTGISEWMDRHNFKTVEEFRGKMSFANIEHPAAYERVQFMKLYSQIK